MLRLLDSFNGYATADIPSAWTGQSGTPAIASGGFGGGNRLQVNGNGWYVEQTIDAQATWLPGAGITIDSLAAAVPLFAVLDGSTIQAYIRVETDGTIKAYRGSGTGNLLGTSTGVTISAGVRFHCETKFVTHNSTGALEVRINGVARLTLAGVNTRSTANNYADRVRLQGISGGISYENVNFKDGQTGLNDFAGDCRVALRVPNGDGAINDFACSSGSVRADLVDDTPPDGDTTYVSSSTPGDRQLLQFADFATLGTILGVQLRVLARKDDVAARTIKLTARPVATNYDSSAFTVQSSYVYSTQVWENNPETATPWTLTTLNASQFGVKLES